MSWRLLLLSMGRRQERGPPRPGTPERRPLVGTVIPPRDVAAQQFGELADRVLERVVDRFRPELEEKFQELNAPLASEVSSLGRRVAALERDSSCVRKAPAA